MGRTYLSESYMTADLVGDYANEEQGEAPSRCFPYSSSENQVEDLNIREEPSSQSGLSQLAGGYVFGVTYRADPADGHEVISGKTFHGE